MTKKEIYYAVYDKQDFLIFVGTAKECSEFLNMTLNSFYCRISRPQKNRQFCVYKFEDGGSLT